LLGGTYRIVRRIGSGGMGEVYEATHARLAHRYAVKFLHPGMRDHPEALPRFMREAQVTSRLRHPGIVSVVDFNTLPDGVAYLVMEYLEGEPLGKVLARTGPFPLPRVVDITDQLSSALTAAHLEGVVHRDMHPQNVFVMPATGGQGERVKILDFGISKIASISQKITGMAAVLGTPQYMSPEQAEGKIAELDAASDQFSLAAIVYEMLTGRPAFSGATLASVAYQVVHAAAAPIRDFRPELPGELDQVLSRALAKNQKARFPSVSEFALHFRWTASLPVNEAQRRSLAEAVGAPTLEADTEETTAVSALPSGMAEVLRQTGLSGGGAAPAASAASRPPTGEAAQNEATVVSPSPFTNNEPTVVSTWGLAADDPSLVSKAPSAENDWPEASRRSRRSTRLGVATAAGLLLVVGAALVARRGGAPTGDAVRASSSPPAPPPAPSAAAVPVAHPSPAPAPETPAALPETTGAARAPGSSAAEATALVRAVAGREAVTPEKPSARGRTRAAAPLKAAAPTVVDRTERPPAAARCRITVGSYPWSELWIDGADTGQQTPVVGLPVACGPHRLELKRRDLKVDQEERVTVNEGWEFKREYELQGAALDE
jgi:eukaryotic-like serine/threonine-protein kinase